MTGLKAAAIGTIGMATIGGLAPTQTDFERVGIISLCVMALIVVWRSGETRQKKIDDLLEKVTRVAEQSNNAIERNTEAMNGLKDEITRLIR